MLRTKRHECRNGSTENPSDGSRYADPVKTVIVHLRRLNGASLSREKSAHVVGELERIRQTLVKLRRDILRNAAALPRNSAGPTAKAASPTEPNLANDNMPSVGPVLKKIDEIIRQIDLTCFKIVRRTTRPRSSLGAWLKVLQDGFRACFPPRRPRRQQTARKPVRPVERIRHLECETDQTSLAKTSV